MDVKSEVYDLKSKALRHPTRDTKAQVSVPIRKTDL